MIIHVWQQSLMKYFILNNNNRTTQTYIISDTNLYSGLDPFVRKIVYSFSVVLKVTK